MNRKVILLLTVVVLVVVMCGCTTLYGQLTVASTKNIDINNKEFELVEEGVTGEDSRPIIIIVPAGDPSIEDAMDAALSKAGGQIMQNVDIYYKWWYIPYIWGKITFVVEGDVYRLVK